MAFPAMRTSFASSSRLTLHHLPSPASIPRHAPHFSPSVFAYRPGSSLAQSSYSSSFDLPTPAYTGPVSTQGKSTPKGGQKEMHAAPKPVEPAPPAAAAKPKAPERRKVELKGKKNAITMTPAAIDHLRSLLASPTEPRMLRISVKSRGCAGMAYHLDYVAPPGGRFDEVVEQDGVKVLIDSKALFSIIGSKMDWRDSRLSAGFVFENPNVVDTCGCGESFNIR
ncbi:hypothetical protein IAT38_004024 [Cryptococcus sp. DSM 104549]